MGRAGNRYGMGAIRNSQEPEMHDGTAGSFHTGAGQRIGSNHERSLGRLHNPARADYYLLLKNSGRKVF